MFSAMLNPVQLLAVMGSKQFQAVLGIITSIHFYMYPNIFYKSLFGRKNDCNPNTKPLSNYLTPGMSKGVQQSFSHSYHPCDFTSTRQDHGDAFRPQHNNSEL